MSKCRRTPAAAPFAMERNLFMMACWIALAMLGASAALAVASEPTSTTSGERVAVMVRVGGEVRSPRSFSASDLADMRRSTLAAAVHGVQATWQGVPLIEILRAAGAPVDAELRGGNLALVVRVSARDGYSAVFALAELDPTFRDDQVLLADRRDGGVIADEEGPFRLVAPGEKRQGRWVRQVDRIDVLRAAK